MSDHKYWDEDVEKAVNNACIGNEDSYEIQFKEPVEAFNIHKDDVIHLAKCFGLAVYEKDTAL